MMMTVVILIILRFCGEFTTRAHTHTHTHTHIYIYTHLYIEFVGHNLKILSSSF